MNFNINVSVNYEYDVVVCGGGFAGVAAAVSAAKQGMRTVLIESGGELGGDITKSLVPQILDADGKGGMVKEIFDFLNSKNRTLPRRAPWYDEYGRNLSGRMIDLEYTKYFLDKVCLGAGVTVIFHSNVFYAITQDGIIKQILVGGEAGCCSVSGKVFIDATGNGVFASMCGCDYSFGHPETSHPQPCSFSLIVTGVDTSIVTDTNSQKIELKSKLQSCGIDVSAEWISIMNLPQRGYKMLSFNNQYDVDPCNFISLSEATSKGRIECIEVTEKMRSIKGFENMEIVAMSSHTGVREGRRINGLYTLTFDDVTDGRRFDDAVCSSSFTIDVHKISKDDKADHKKGKQVKTYHIPYRSLVSSDCKNLLLAGRCISGDFYAHASYRVVGNVIATGEAAGFAAAISVKENCLPASINGTKISKFMQEIGYDI